MITRRIPPAGDPFTAKPVPAHEDHARPCFVCMDGYVWLGYSVDDPEFGNEDEVLYERVACTRCPRSYESQKERDD